MSSVKQDVSAEKQKVNIQQQAVLDTKDQNIVVAASAGSGKTRVLIEKIGKTLVDDQLEIEQILALTFTDNAANEMKNRISGYFEKLISIDPINIEYYQRQIAKLPISYISTFHSFCLRIVQTYYSIIGLSASTVLNVIDPHMADKISEQTIEVTFNHFRKESAFKRLLWSTSSNATDFDSLKRVVKLLALKMRQSDDTTAFTCLLINQYRSISNIQDNPSVASYLKELFLAIESDLDYITSQANLDPIKKGKKDKPNKKDNQDIFLAKKALIKKILLQENFDEIVISLKELLGFTFRNPTTKDELLKIRFGSLKSQEAEIVTWLSDSQYFDHEMTDIVEQITCLVKMGEHYSSQFKLAKQQIGIDYDDMEDYCLAILKADDGLVAKKIQDQFRNIYIDEFQDTSNIQDLIIINIQKTNNVLRVGDIKQSIYAFRNAKPKLFLDYQSDQYNNKVIRLVKNYRSRKHILDFINQIFQPLFNIAGLPTIFTKDDLVECERDPSEDDELLNNIYRIEITTIKPKIILLNKASQAIEVDEDNEESVDVNATDVEQLSDVEMKVHYIAAEINRLHAAGINYSDIVILKRSHTQNHLIGQIFTSLNIPIKISVKGSFLKSRVVQMMMASFTLVNNPDNEIALISVLNSFYQINHQTLAQWRVEDGKSDWWTLLRKNNLEHYKDLCFLLSKSKGSSLHQLFDIWYLKLHSVPLPLTAIERSNLFLLKDMIDHFKLGLACFIVEFEDLKKEANEVEANVFSNQDQAVKVETIHQSKGKEYPYVFIWGCDRSDEKDLKKSIFVHSDYGINFNYVDQPIRYKKPNIFSEVIKRQIKTSTLGEEIRILYVAMSRAIQQLYYVDVAKKKFENFQLISNKLTVRDILGSGLYTTWLVIMAKRFGEQLLAEVIYADQEIASSQTYIEQEPDKFTYNIQSMEFVDAPTKHPFNTAWGAEKGMEKGTIFHQEIEHHLKQGSLPSDQKLKALFEDEIFKRCLTKEFYSEYPFFYNQQGQTIKGIIDFICFDNNEIIIIDFKSDKINDSLLLLELYTQQINTYTRVISEGFNLPVRGFIYSIELAKMIEVKDENI